MEVDTVHIRGILSALNKGAVFIFCGSSMLQLLLIRSNIATTPFWNFFVSMVVLLFFTFVFNVAGYTKGCNRSLFNRNNQVLFLILFLAIGCAKGSENGEILAGQVGITWPKNHVTYSSWHWLLLHLCVQVKEKIADGSIIEKSHQICIKHQQQDSIKMELPLWACVCAAHVKLCQDNTKRMNRGMNKTFV